MRRSPLVESIRRAARLGALAAVVWAVAAGCALWGADRDFYVSSWHGFRVRRVKQEPWRPTPDVADVLALNDPGTSVLYYDNPHSGGVISLQVLPRHFSGRSPFSDELTFIYRRMLSTPHHDMRAEAEGKFVPFERAVRYTEAGEARRAEFLLRGSMGRRPTARARELARERLEESQPFGGPRTQEEVHEARLFRSQQLTPAYTGHYRGKVVVFLREGTLYEFYYIDHALAYESGVKDFDAFVGSLEFFPGGLFGGFGLRPAGGG